MEGEIIIKILVMAAVGGIIGYTTNVLAVKMLFRPFEEINILGFRIQGLIPKRKTEIATNIGKTIGEELIDYDRLIDSLISDEDMDKLKTYIKERALRIIGEKTSMIPFLFRGRIMYMAEEILESEVDEAVDSMVIRTKDTISDRIDIGKMVEDNLNMLDLKELEELIMKISKKELKHIEVLGLFLGFIIGIVQGIISVFI